MTRRLRILIVDDEEIVCTRLKPALEKSGHDVVTCTDSARARDDLSGDRFDVVVTDLKMPDVDGMELYRFIHEKWPETKVIIISGFATVDVAREALQAGVRDVIAKPFKIAELKELINRIAGESGRPESDGGNET